LHDVTVSTEDLRSAIHTVDATSAQLSRWPDALPAPHITTLTPGPGVVLRVPGRGKLVAYRRHGRGIVMAAYDADDAPDPTAAAGIARLWGAEPGSALHVAVRDFARDAAHFAVALNKVTADLFGARVAPLITAAIGAKVGLSGDRP
jgi:hypothetical protein